MNPLIHYMYGHVHPHEVTATWLSEFGDVFVPIDFDFSTYCVYFCVTMHWSIHLVTLS
jgi:hypothetical protein